jgi:hypothetical protein
VNRLLVSTECPACGAVLDFSEGSNAVTCGHCRSNLLVTGKGQILSYSVAPRLEERKAIALATMALRNLGRSDFRIVKSQLYFLPYYRLTGQDFGWEGPTAKPVKEEESYLEQEIGIGSQGRSRFPIGDVPSLFEAAGELFNVFMNNTFGRNDASEQTYSRAGQTSMPIDKIGSERSCDIRTGNNSQLTRSTLYEKGEVVLNDRYVEKNFLACDLKGAGLYSLGVRPAVLRLELFRKEALGETGRLVNPTVTSDAALEVGLKTEPNPALLYRQVISKVLSIIYFPFWIIETESKGGPLVTIIDAVAQTIIKPDAVQAIYEILDRQFVEDPKIIGFRPLTCPNCGWDFPVRPDDSIFFCSTCKKAWEICGKELCEINYEVAAVDEIDLSGQVKYLPFWIISCLVATKKPLKYYIPAFRYRRLKLLLDLALCLSRIQPEFPKAEIRQQNLSACYYDSHDAAMLAKFAEVALKAENIDAYRTNKADDLPVTGSTLAWLPFEIKGSYLVSTFAKISIPQNLLI